MLGKRVFRQEKKGKSKSKKLKERTWGRPSVCGDVMRYSVSPRESAPERETGKDASGEWGLRRERLPGPNTPGCE